MDSSPPLMCVNLLSIINKVTTVQKNNIFTSALLPQKVISSQGRYCPVSNIFTMALLPESFFLYRCYYPHWLTDSVSPVYGIFLNKKFIFPKISRFWLKFRFQLLKDVVLELTRKLFSCSENIF